MIRILLAISLLISSSPAFGLKKDLGIYYCEFINSVGINYEGKVKEIDATFYKKKGRDTKFKLDWQKDKVTFTKTAPFIMYPSNTFTLTEDPFTGFEVNEGGMSFYFHNFQSNIWTLVHSSTSHMDTTVYISECEKF